MAVKLRLQRKGRKKAPYYHIVVADSRSPRDGKFIERLGMYNPISKPAIIELDSDRAFYWLGVGAQPTDTVNAILKYKGVLYRKHLQRGVKKGAFSQETADKMYQDWIAAKESTISSKVAARKQEIADMHKAISGTKKEAKPKPVVEEAPAVEESAVSEETAAPEASAEETAPAE